MRYLLTAGLFSTNSLDYHVTPVSFRVGGCFSGGQDSWDLWVRRIQRAEHSVGGYAAGATGSGAWTGHLVCRAGVYLSQTSAALPDHV